MAGRSLRKQLLKDGNPAVRSMEFPESKLMGSVQGEGLEQETVQQRRELLEPWLNELLVVCPGNPHVMRFLANPVAKPTPARGPSRTEAPAVADYDELDYHPDSVELVLTRVDGDIEDPCYVMKCSNPAGQCWPIARRFTDFCSLEKELRDNPALRDLHFPKKKMFYSSWGKKLWGAKETVTGATSVACL
jgi:hypothetical protein